MNNIHPASINPKMNKRKYMNKIREKYIDNYKDDKNDKKIVGGDNEVYEIDENNGKMSNYLYIGALTTMIGELGTIIYWFLIS
jgi:hypothetical protein